MEEILEELRDFEFTQYFGVTNHTLKLDHTDWKWRKIREALDEGIRGIK